MDDLDLAYGIWGDFEVTKLFDSRGPLSREQVKDKLRQLGFEYTHDEFYAPTGLDHPSYFLKAEEYN